MPSKSTTPQAASSKVKAVEITPAQRRRVLEDYAAELRKRSDTLKSSGRAPSMTIKQQLRFMADEASAFAQNITDQE